MSMDAVHGRAFLDAEFCNRFNMPPLSEPLSLFFRLTALGLGSR